MERKAVRVVSLAVLLAALVHVDWHVGRPGHMRMSLDWGWHWLVGVAAGAGMAWIVARRVAVGAAVRELVLVGAVGLFLGQIVEPTLEVVGYGVTWAQVYPDVRWRLFAEFSVAWGVAVGLGLAAAGMLSRRSENVDG